MLFSIFTPTHRPQFLEETYQSLCCQDQAFEWIVVPNCKVGGEMPRIPAKIVADKRVTVIPFQWEDKPKIGALKRFCCEHAKGDVFVELDHDDMLVPGVLSEIARCVNDGAGFVYSDAALFTHGDDMTPHWYHGDWGWETYDFRIYGKRFVATRSFPLTPRSLCEIYFAPDHVRCWTREAYFKAGGYDAEMEVGDDHDLIVRTYLKGCKFVHTGTVGYLYRVHPENTVKSHNSKIQKQQTKTRDKYIHKLIDEWLRRTKHGYLDLQKKPWRLLADGKPRIDRKDNSVGCIRAYDCFHLIEQKWATELLNECYRVLIPGGWLCVRFPSTGGSAAFAPVCKSYWNMHTFEYYSNKKFARRIPGNKARFQLVRAGEYYRDAHDERWKKLLGYVDLVALKGQRNPGKVSI